MREFFYVVTVGYFRRGTIMFNTLHGIIDMGEGVTRVQAYNNIMDGAAKQMRMPRHEMSVMFLSIEPSDLPC